MKEVFKVIPEYEDYQVSNLGNVKSFKISKEGKIMKPSITKNGYLTVKLYNNKGKTHKVHQLVAMIFMNHIPNGYKTIINHKNENKTDNRLENLELCTNRYNVVYSIDKRKTSSQYTGVWWHNQRNKWGARISIDGVYKHIGLFDNEYDAHLAYQDALKNINNNGKKTDYSIR